MYQSQFVSEDKAFTCVPCKADSDCAFKSETFCVSGPSSVGPYSLPVPIMEPTGKCVANACEFKMDFCSDGDYTTYGSCQADWAGSNYKLYKAGVCAHTKLQGATFDFDGDECWCKDADTLECVKFKIHPGSNDTFEVDSDQTKNCPGGCNWSCL